MHADHWTRYEATGPMHGSGDGKWVKVEEAQDEYARLSARVTELETAVRDLLAYDDNAVIDRAYVTLTKGQA